MTPMGQPVVKVRRSTETSDAPGWQGVEEAQYREYCGEEQRSPDGMQRSSNAGRLSPRAAGTRRLFLLSPFLAAVPGSLRRGSPSLPSATGAAARAVPEGGPSAAQSKGFLFDGKALARNRQLLKDGDKQLTPALARLRSEADRALAAKEPSVMDKKLLPVSGDKHDYFSYGPYWWPDPTKPDGLPYIRRDGEVNPESDTGTDDIAFGQVCSAVETLGLAYWFTGDARYATKAASFVRVWFLDPKTRMNPNFQHAQAIPGITPGRGIGLIESRRLMGLNEGLSLFGESSGLAPAERKAFGVWLDAFYVWLTTSSNGRDESKEENNHGTWYDAQTAHLALVLDRKDEARAILTRGLDARLAKHVEPDGSQPRELARTRSLNYSLFNLEALFACAALAEHVGVDWWKFTTKDGRSLGRALAYVAPYVDPAKAWPKQDVAPGDRSRLLPLFAQYLKHNDDAAIRTLYRAHGATAKDARFRLLSPPPA
jgi:hypothetical protein